MAELFQDDIARFRVLLTGEVTEDPLEVLGQGGVPRLPALQLHNGTVYRWNRPCYGISEGKPHLRIECRVLPSGPTVTDEVANAAFWIGLVLGAQGNMGMSPAGWTSTTPSPTSWLPAAGGSTPDSTGSAGNDRSP